MGKILIALGLAIFAAVWLAAYYSAPVSSMDFRCPDPPFNVTVQTSFGYACTTPCQVNVYTRDDFTVTFSLPGYRSQTHSIRVKAGGDTHTPSRLYITMERER